MARRSFPCGHAGKAQFCHRCKQAELEAAKKAQAKASEVEERRADKQAWEATFAADAFDLHVLQTRERVTKARDILQRLASGEPYTALGGKRWESDRNIVSGRRSGRKASRHAGLRGGSRLVQDLKALLS